jgi:hypothetical protein
LAELIGGKGYQNGLELRFKISAAGGGNTDLSVRIPPGGYDAVTKAMIEVDEDAAIRAFGAALLARKGSHSN